MSHFFITGTKYLTPATEGSRGLFWLMVTEGAVLAGLVPRQNHHAECPGYSMASESREQEGGGQRKRDR